MEAQSFYEPSDRGFEAKVRERLDYWKERREALQQSRGEPG
jgi:putative ATPase